MTPTKKNERTHDVTVAEGTQTHLNNATLTIDGQQMTGPQIITRIDARVAILDDVTAKKAQLKASMDKEKADRPAFRSFMGSYTSILLGMYTSDPKTLADFDITPRKKAPKAKTAEKALSAEKAVATRKARHTMGKKQKKAIKGTVELTQEQLQALQAAAAGNEPAVSPAPAPAVEMPSPAVAPAASPAHPSASNGK